MFHSTLSTDQNHLIHRNPNGTITLAHIPTGETMHSYIGPCAEAELLYIEQSQLRERLLRDVPKDLVVFDLGLGAAANALGAIECQKRLRSDFGKVSRKLHVISFENDLSGLQLAYANLGEFPFMSGSVDAVQALLERGRWRSDDANIEWELKLGEFPTSLGDAPSPEIIYFDFYSPRATPGLWSIEIFKKLFACSNPETMLYTYSASTKVRVAMLYAGFFVGFGRATTSKRDTTIAATNLTRLVRPLGDQWLGQLRRSHDFLPYGTALAEKDLILARVLAHKQFDR
jgi:queuine tRNA-ribosyltransferase